jgi:HAD superfamily hydrolase (TIGR01549 family)
MKRRPASRRRNPIRKRDQVPAFLFDLDGTLVDSAYEHAVTWRNAFRRAGVEIPTWKVHRQIGMSGGLLTQALLSELGAELSPELLERVKTAHSEEYEAIVHEVRPLPGAKELLSRLTRFAVPWIVATSSRTTNARRTLAKLGQSLEVAVTRDDVERAKPDPDLFLKAADQLGVPIEKSMVVGDSIWDILAARRAGALGVGLLSGGTSREELELAGALRVYRDPEDLLQHLHELGVRPPAGQVPENGTRLRSRRPGSRT